MKIAIMGYSGAGKSTLSKQLGEIYRCPVLYLDCVEYEAGWNTRDIESARSIVADFMRHDSWIIDGNYQKFDQKQRLADADQIIFLNFSWWRCLWRAFRRYARYRNRTRESITSGCKEKLDFQFIKWILHDGRTRDRKRHFAGIAEEYAAKFIRLSKPKQLRLFLQQLDNN